MARNPYSGGLFREPQSGYAAPPAVSEEGVNYSRTLERLAQRGLYWDDGQKRWVGGGGGAMGGGMSMSGGGGGSRRGGGYGRGGGGGGRAAAAAAQRAELMAELQQLRDASRGIIDREAAAGAPNRQLIEGMRGQQALRGFAEAARENYTGGRLKAGPLAGDLEAQGFSGQAVRDRQRRANRELQGTRDRVWDRGLGINRAYVQGTRQRGADYNALMGGLRRQLDARFAEGKKELGQ